MHDANSMTHDNSSKAKGRYSDRLKYSLAPIQRSFPSAPRKSRARSSSPRKRLVRQPLHVRMDLTETQMDKITNAFTHKLGSSPTKPRKRTDAATPTSTPRKSRSPQGQQAMTQQWETNERSHQFNSPTFSELMPRHQAGPNDSFSANLAARRHKAVPPPIQTSTMQQRPRLPLRARMESIPSSISPLSPTRYSLSQLEGEEEASLYSPNRCLTARPEPLDLRSSDHGRSHSRGNDAPTESHQDWSYLYSPSSSRDSPNRHGDPVQRPRRSKSTGERLRQQRYPAQQLQMPPCVVAQAIDTPLFSPLQFYFRGNDFPSMKMGEKVMIGDNGWLERTEKNPEQDKKATQKKTSILDSIKKVAKDMAELHHSHRWSQHATKGTSSSRVAISLDPREQSLLYCELEFRLSNALNDYITAQLDKGRLVPDKLKKIADGWSNKGRPKVVGFRYDLETQLDLVSLHVDDFGFYGRRHGNPVEISGLLHAMKANARAMSIRTFCQPDSVIAKQLVDAQSLFKMVNVPDAQQLALAEIAQFFKVIMEREQDQREQMGHQGGEAQMTRGYGEYIWQGRATLRNDGGRLVDAQVGKEYGSDEKKAGYAK